MRQLRVIPALLAAGWIAVIGMQPVLAQAMPTRPTQDRERDALVRLADEAAAKGLPVGPLTNKIREGLAKNVDPKLIELVVRQMATHLETADRLMREMEPAPRGATLEASVTLLAESLGGGVTSRASGPRRDH